MCYAQRPAIPMPAIAVLPMPADHAGDGSVMVVRSVAGRHRRARAAYDEEARVSPGFSVCSLRPAAGGIGPAAPARSTLLASRRTGDVDGVRSGTVVVSERTRKLGARTTTTCSNRSAI